MEEQHCSMYRLNSDAHFVLNHLLIGAKRMPLGELISTVVIYDSVTRAETLVTVCEMRT